MNGSHFRSFFRAIQGADPFPWQERLARRLADVHLWPSVIDLPTGAGKTACIDIALFHFILCAQLGRPHDAQRRIAFVVDRRIIVDEAAVRAARIRDAIAGATDGILCEVREVLTTTTGSATIDVRTLRGGVVREKNLVRDPGIAAVILSTVDQLGSRLLFRGYGVTDRAKPMHAGMFGFDTLLLLDEAHIAEPFRQTLDGIVREQSRSTVRSFGPRPLQWVQLSATPSGAADFSLQADDRASPTLAKRLVAHKPLQLLEVAKRETLVDALSALVGAELGAAPLSPSESPRIGIVVNRVATARALAEHLRKKYRDSVEVHLLIGRTRPLDRDRLVSELAPKLKSSVEPRPGDKPIIVVATQTIEVGADFDFHSMFIESATYAAIKQRIGRLNRLGVRDAARGAIVHVKADADDDPLYGPTLGPTWELLQAAASGGLVDLGIDFAPLPRANTTMPLPITPDLSPSLLDLLVQTSPRPAVEPDVASFLHGFTDEKPDIAVVWRDGLIDSEHAIDEELATQILDRLPPLSIEAMSLPLSAFRPWAASWGTTKKTKTIEGGDIDGDRFADESDASDAPCIRVTESGIELIPAERVRPGDMIVVPGARGGADQFGFAPNSDVRVSDLSLAARSRAQRSLVVLWTPALARTWYVADDDESAYRHAVDQLAETLADGELADGDARDLLFDWFDAWRSGISELVVSSFDRLRHRSNPCESLDVNGVCRGLVLRAGKPVAEDLVDEVIGLQRTVEVDLESHGRGVAEFAERFAKRLGMDAERVADLKLAGRLHDVGKADPRFQAMLDAPPDRVLAKSPRFNRSVRIGARHECYSLAVVDTHPELIAGAADADLVRFLIGSHHGYGHGLQPIVDDRGVEFDVEIEGVRLAFRGRATSFELDSGWPDLFADLQRRYGPWGLAFLEAVLRLADHRRSEAELDGAAT